MNHAAALEILSFDHRGSIVGFLNEQANKLEVSGQKLIASALRAQASNVAIQMDIRSGARGIASPVDAIIVEICALVGGTNHAEVSAHHGGSEATKRARLAAMWVAKKKLPDWTDEQIAVHFRRDRSTVSHGIKRAELLRDQDANFRAITDNLVKQPMRCENCQHPLLSV